MRGVFTITLIAGLCLSLMATAPVAAESPELDYGRIPFGKTQDEVLGMYEGSEVTREETPYIESIGNYVLQEHFKGGLKKDDSGVCFLPAIVRKYTVKNREWERCDSLTLYFGAFEKKAADYTLFMVKKTLPAPPPEADFKKVFDDLAGNMDLSTGKGHTVSQGRVQSFSEESHTFYLPALVGTWQAPDALVFIMTANSPGGPLPPEEVFVSRPALQRYLEVCRIY